MHVQRLILRNVRSIREFDLRLRPRELPGWHVILGDNGAGKSTVVRALALALMGQSNAHATREDWSRWLTDGEKSGSIDIRLRAHDQDRWTGRGRQGEGAIYAKAKIRANSGSDQPNGGHASIEFDANSSTKRTVWGDGMGWFSASFGPFRRFSGADLEVDRLYVTHPRLAPHLSAFGENVALGESLRWLKNLQIRKLENNKEAARVQEAVLAFVNGAGLLPHGARISGVTSEQVQIVDGFGSQVAVQEMSDGYRSILSMTFELMRLLFSAFGTDTALRGIDMKAGTITLPGVVAIDEIDAHLHPGWQQLIGDWFVNRFPNMQFLVTTHSPIICRAARHGTIWLLPTPGSEGQLRRVIGPDRNRLIDGNILDAYGTELFGEEVTRSEQSKAKLTQLAQLNRKRLRQTLSSSEQRELEQLRETMPSTPNNMAAD